MSDQDCPPHGCMPGDVQDLELPHALMSDGTGDLGVQPQANVQDNIAMLENCSDFDSTTDEYLENLVLSWSISSIRMEPMMIPKIHGGDGLSPQEYLRSFKKPLVEEARAFVLSGLTSIPRPYYKLLNILPMSKAGLFYLDIDTRFGDHIPQDGDLFLLSNHHPEHLQLMDDSQVFALAINNGHHQRYVSGFQSNILRDISSSNFKFAVFLCNIHKKLCLWKTLHMDIGERPFIKQISAPSLIAKGSCEICAKQSGSQSPLFSDGLNKTQEELAMTVLSDAKCGHHETMNLVWGLPGTGKTRTISVVLAGLLRYNVKTLVCAPNNIHFSSIGCYLHGFIKRKDLCYGLDRSVGDVLLLCDLVGVKDEAVRTFCIEWRLSQIIPSMVWRGKIKGLISFLEKDFRENYKEVTKGKLTVLDMFKEMLERKSSSLKKIMMTLWKHMPSHVFSQEIAKNLACLFEALRGFHELLSQDSITNEDVMTAFGIYSATNLPPQPRRVKFSTKKSSRTTQSHFKPSLSTPHPKPTYVSEIRKAKENCLKHLKYLESNLELPYEKDVDWMRQYLIRESIVILSLPHEAFTLHKVDTGQREMLLVVGAAQIKECELIPALSLPSIQHVWLIGDHVQLCPTVNSKMNENSGFKLSLFERYISSGFKKYMLTTQYRMHPDISSLASTYFYEGKLSNAKLVDLDVMKMVFTNYMFVNVDPDKVPVVILSLITAILKASKTPECQGSKLKVGVICSTEKKKVQGYNNHGPITLSIHSMDEMEEKYYDIIIVAADGIETSKNTINYMITRARKYMWIVGNESVLTKNEMWKMLIESAKQKGCFKESTYHLKFSSIIKDTSSWEILISTLGIITPQGNIPLREFTLYGQTHNGIPLTTPVRDQRGENHCTLLSSLTTMEFQNKHRSASSVPPIIFPHTFSAKKLLADYKEKYGEIGKEESGRGTERLENVLHLVQTEGAISELDNEVYKIDHFGCIYDSRNINKTSLEVATEKLRKGKAMIGTFPISKSYQEYKPGDIYRYDPNQPILSPLSRNPTSHAAMFIGNTEGTTKILLEKGHFVMQNSQGEYFGYKGIGRVSASSVKHLYEITL